MKQRILKVPNSVQVEFRDVLKNISNPIMPIEYLIGVILYLSDGTAGYVSIKASKGLQFDMLAKIIPDICKHLQKNKHIICNIELEFDINQIKLDIENFVKTLN